MGIEPTSEIWEAFDLGLSLKLNRWYWWTRGSKRTLVKKLYPLDQRIAKPTIRAKSITYAAEQPSPF